MSVLQKEGNFEKLLQYYQKFNSSEKKIISEVSSREGKREWEISLFSWSIMILRGSGEGNRVNGVVS